MLVKFCQKDMFNFCIRHMGAVDSCNLIEVAHADMSEFIRLQSTSQGDKALFEMEELQSSAYSFSNGSCMFIPVFSSLEC